MCSQFGSGRKDKELGLEARLVAVAMKAENGISHILRGLVVSMNGCVSQHIASARDTVTERIPNVA